MKISKLFTKTTKNAPADETSKNAKLLIQAGFIHKEMAGVYSFLPLGLRVLKNIENIIREEMNAVGGQEVEMTALQIRERYEASGRWSDEVVDNWFKTKLANGSEIGLGFSHEENLTPIMLDHVKSYRDLPVAAYQIQTKFRNELRSKSGIMRGREFLMKDMYTYSIDEKQHDEYYERIKQAYIKIYHKLGIGDSTFTTFASGGSFAQFSHEFQTLSDAGEDTIYLDRKTGIAVNKEVYTDDVVKQLGLTKSELEEVKGIEVGNIFSLGTKFTKPFNLTVDDETGKTVTPIMGCYGIGVSRVMGTIAEILSDDKGLVWPENIAPAKVYLIALGGSDVIAETDKIYDMLSKKGISVIYDDRETSAGEKFGDADLMGIPYRLVVSSKNIESGKYELKKRTESDLKMLDIDDILEVLVS